MADDDLPTTDLAFKGAHPHADRGNFPVTAPTNTNPLPPFVHSLKPANHVTLVRHLRSGRDITNADLTPRQALTTAGQMLYDNNVMSKYDAQIWAAKLPLNQRVDHESGYGVTITEENV